jgi:ATP-dependent DNA ligase
VLIVGMLVNEPFDDKGWVFETKWDGFRLVTEKHYPRTSVSRNF